MVKEKNTRPVSKSLKEYARGIVGGLLFSFPLLFTMEVWWAGFSASPLQLLLLMVVTFLLLLGYNRFAGMRNGTSWRSIMIDSVEEMGIGLVLSFLVLLMLNRIQLYDMQLGEIMGKTIIEAMGVSIGVSIGTAQLGVAEEVKEEDEGKAMNEQPETGNGGPWWSEKLSLVALALCGAIIVAGNVAPTEEVVLLAIESSPLHILVMAIASLSISMLVVFFSDFKGTIQVQKKTIAYTVIFDTCLSYLVAFVSSAFCLWFFGRFANVSFYIAFSECVVLSVLASLGASAGRLLIK